MENLHRSHGILVEWILWLEIEELSRPQIPAKFKNIFDFGRDRSGVPSHASQTLYHWAMKAWYFKAWNILKISSGATQPGQPGHWAAQKNRSTSTVWYIRKKLHKVPNIYCAYVNTKYIQYLCRQYFSDTVLGAFAIFQESYGMNDASDSLDFFFSPQENKIHRGFRFPFIFLVERNDGKTI